MFLFPVSALYFTPKVDSLMSNFVMQNSFCYGDVWKSNQGFLPLRHQVPLVKRGDVSAFMNS